MDAVRTAPNVFSFSAAISSCEKAQEWQMALYILSKMSEAEAPRLHDIGSWSQGKRFCFRASLRCYSATNREVPHSRGPIENSDSLSDR